MSQDSKIFTAPAALAETLLKGQKKVFELALRGAPLAEVLEVLVRTIETQSVNHLKASILLLDPGSARLRHGAAPSLPAAYNQAIDGILIGYGVGSCGTAAFTARTVVVENIATDPLWADFKDLALAHGLQACWSTPILSSQEQVLGTFALYHPMPMAPSAVDLDTVSLLAQTAAIVLERDWHARKRAAAEADLLRSQQRQLEQLRQMFEHAPAAIAYLSGPEQVFEVANPKYRELVGGRDVCGLKVREALPEVEGQGFFELLDRVLQTGEPFIGRGVRILLARGQDGLDEVFVDFVYQPIPDESGAFTSIMVVAFEVTELVQARLEAEAARSLAEASEQGLRTFIDNLPELAWTALPDGSIDSYNQRWYAYTGTSFEQMQGWGWEQVHDPALLPEVLTRWRQSLSSGEPFEMEFTLRRADGARRWFLTRVMPVRDAEGHILRWFGTNTDIHELKMAYSLAAAMTQQSLDVQQSLLEMRADKERAEARTAALETDYAALQRHADALYERVCMASDAEPTSAQS